MSIRLLLFVLVLAGTGCRTWSPVAPVADADDRCYQACTPSLTDTGVRWEADPEDPAAWDALGAVVVPQLIRKLLACEAARQSCAGFINDLKHRKVIKGRER